MNELNSVVDVLNTARSLIINIVPCNNALAKDQFVIVHEDRNLNGEYFNFGLINAVFKAHDLPLVVVMWEVDEDANKPNKMIGFCEYVK